VLWKFAAGCPIMKRAGKEREHKFSTPSTSREQAEGSDREIANTKRGIKAAKRRSGEDQSRTASGE